MQKKKLTRKLKAIRADLILLTYKDSKGKITISELADCWQMSISGIYKYIETEVKKKKKK